MQAIHRVGVRTCTLADCGALARARNRTKTAAQVTLIVNVASACGYTDANYKGLQALHERFSPRGFSVLAFPCDCFGHQEPGSDAEIAAFAASRGATFPLFAKIEGVNGDAAAPVYDWLHLQRGFEADVSWNFNKVSARVRVAAWREHCTRADAWHWHTARRPQFLIGRSGKPLKRYGPAWEEEAIVADVEEALSAAFDEADAF